MNPKRPPIIWTETKLRLLRDYYPTMFNDALARWIGCSERSLQRKAHELGLKKVRDFNTLKADGISEHISIGLKKAYSEGRKTTQFVKGVRNNPAGEFKPGHQYPEEIEEARKEKIRRTYKKRKLLKIYSQR